jgi:hypothetical protein
LEEAVGAHSHAEEAIFAVQGLRDAMLLRDSDGVLGDLKTRAGEFVWTPELRAEAHRAASYQLMGNAEELHKLLRGLAEEDDLALLNGVWGWAGAAPKVVALYLGVLSRGDNLFRAQVCEAVGVHSDWTRFHNIAIGASAGPGGGSPLVGQASGAFWLYEATARLLDSALRPEHRAVVETAIETAHRSGLIPAP